LFPFIPGRKYERAVERSAYNVRRDILAVVIGTFADRDAELIFDGARSRRYSGLESIIERKLRAIEAATVLQDLAVPPGNRLEALKGGRKGQHSVRVNDQYRICFRWKGSHAYEIEIVDYH
jgi:proteic killer suppression protein